VPCVAPGRPGGGPSVLRRPDGRCSPHVDRDSYRGQSRCRRTEFSRGRGAHQRR
jgi:hypothetical protein